MIALFGIFLFYVYVNSDDFKPASVDTSKEASVEVGKGNQVTVTVPHVEVSILLLCTLSNVLPNYLKSFILLYISSFVISSASSILPGLHK